jgi:hypothetical protein
MIPPKTGFGLGLGISDGFIHNTRPLLTRALTGPHAHLAWHSLASPGPIDHADREKLFHLDKPFFFFFLETPKQRNNNNTLP